MKIIQVVNNLNCGGLEKTVIYLSKALKDNGHDVLIVCLSRVGDFYPEVKKTIRDLNLNEDIICPGFIPDGELCQFYNAC